MKWLALLTIVGLVPFISIACYRDREPPPPTVVFTDDAPEAGMSPCGQMCKTLELLKCPEALPTKTGATCYRVCVRVQASRESDLKPACVGKATSQDAVRACGSVRCAP